MIIGIRQFLLSYFTGLPALLKMLRIVLAVVAAANFFAAYTFFFTPEVIVSLYRLDVLDGAHIFMAMTVGALMSVFGLGALLALLHPLKYGSLVIMLLLMHFMIFIVCVIVLARGQMQWNVLVPEMVYFLVVSTALVRWFPVRDTQRNAGMAAEDSGVT